MKKRLEDKSIAVLIESMDMYAFYRETAEVLGMAVAEEDSFDCTKICISETILRKWEKQFIEKYGKGNLPELMQFLCLVGPKTDKKLGPDEVEVGKEFVVRKGSMDIS